MGRRSTIGDVSASIPLQKRLGQHHLTSGRACAPLIEYLEPGDRLVVEIGPGGGVLTEQLLIAGGRVIAFEVDPAWGFSLPSRSALAGARVVMVDALDVDWSRFPLGTLVAGNLPFNIATVLIERILAHWRVIPKAGFLVQKEVGERLVASPGRRAYGALTILTAARAKTRTLGDVRKGSFRPPPKVDATFIGLELHRPPLAEAEMADFATMVRLAFSQRRKQIRNSLALAWGRSAAAEALAAAAIPPAARAEVLRLEDFLRLHHARSQWCSAVEGE